MAPSATSKNRPLLIAGANRSMVTADSNAPAPKAINQAVARSPGVQIKVVSVPNGKDNALSKPIKRANKTKDSITTKTPTN